MRIAYLFIFSSLLPVFWPNFVAAQVSTKFVYQGDGQLDYFGGSVVSLGDVTGDGVEDLAVGSPLNSEKSVRAGKISLVSGASLSLAWEIFGSFAYENFGSVISKIDDIDKDGLSDLAVGADYESLAFTPVQARGWVRFFSGRDGHLIDSITGPDISFGSAISGVADYNGDGIGEILIGNHSRAGKKGELTGAATIYSGASRAVLREHVGIPVRFPGESFGRATSFGSRVSNLGDVNKDGTADYIIAATSESIPRSSAGAVYLYSGKTGKILRKIRGTGLSQHLGYSVGPAGDLNRDSYDDFIVGRSQGSNKHEVRIFSGKNGKPLTQFKSLGTPGVFPLVFVHIGDINSDGTPDYAGNKFTEAFGSVDGKLTIFSGSKLEVLRELPIQASSVTGIGDRDGDGVPDLAVTDQFSGINGSVSGVLELISAVNGGVINSLTGKPSKDDDYGREIYFLGDVNGDAEPDLVVASPEHDGVANNTGIVQVISGLDGAVLSAVEGASADEKLGLKIWPLKDITGDGKADYAIGKLIEDRYGTLIISFDVYSGANSVPVQTVSVPEGLISLTSIKDDNGDGQDDLVFADILGIHFLSGGAEYKLLSRSQSKAVFPTAGGLSHGYDGLQIMPDITGDGIGELVVPLTKFSISSSGGMTLQALGVGLLSGSNLAPIFTRSEIRSDTASQLKFSIIADTNQDGAPEIFVGDPTGKSPKGLSSGIGYVLSGRTGETMLSLYPVGADFGGIACPLKDIDDDGVDEFAVSGQDVAYIFSGKSGALLHAHQPFQLVGRHTIDTAIDCAPRSSSRAELAVAATSFGISSVPGSAFGVVSYGPTGSQFPNLSFYELDPLISSLSLSVSKSNFRFFAGFLHQSGESPYFDGSGSCEYQVGLSTNKEETLSKPDKKFPATSRFLDFSANTSGSFRSSQRVYAGIKLVCANGTVTQDTRQIEPEGSGGGLAFKAWKSQVLKRIKVKQS